MDLWFVEVFQAQWKCVNLIKMRLHNINSNEKFHHSIVYICMTLWLLHFPEISQFSNRIFTDDVIMVWYRAYTIHTWSREHAFRIPFVKYERRKCNTIFVWNVENWIFGPRIWILNYIMLYHHHCEYNIVVCYASQPGSQPASQLWACDTSRFTKLRQYLCVSLSLSCGAFSQIGCMASKA